MKIRRRRRDEGDVDSSSLNDIMFFLMLFFLIASTLANPNVFPIKLPTSKNPGTIVPRTVPLTVKRDGDELHVYIEQNEVAYEELESKLKALRDASLAEAKAMGSDEKNAETGLNIVLRVDKQTNVQDLVDVLQVGANLGIKMVLATEKKTQ